MQIDAFLLADAIHKVGGKLYILGGGWNRTWPGDGRYPYRKTIPMGVSISVGWQETNELHRFEITIADADGKQLVEPISGEFEVGRAPGMDPSEDVLMTMAIPPVVDIPGPGTYVVQLSVDGTPMARRKFRSVYPGNETRPPQSAAPDQLEDAGGGGDASED